MVKFIGFSTYNKKRNFRLYDIDLVKQDILNQFMTRRGERVMLPNYGSIVWDMIMEPLTQPNKDMIIADAVRIINSEPRVKLENIDVTEVEYGLIIRMKILFVSTSTVEDLQIQFDRDTREIEG